MVSGHELGLPDGFDAASSGYAASDITIVR
jgi:hypothetical protein